MAATDIADLEYKALKALVVEPLKQEVLENLGIDKNTLQSLVKGDLIHDISKTDSVILKLTPHGYQCVLEYESNGNKDFYHSKVT